MNTIKQISSAVYHSPETPGLSSSGIREFLKSPAHFRAYIDNPQPQTLAMALGEAVHCAVLEPQRFDAEYCVAPVCDRRTKEGKYIYSEFEKISEGKRIITADDSAAIIAMQKSVLRRETVRGMLTGCDIEMSILWGHEIGFQCKARPDAINLVDGYIVDLKTTQDATPAAFARSCANYGYDVQAAWYLNGAAIVTGVQFNDFYFIAVEKSPPYEVGIYKCAPQMIVNGLRKIREMIPQYAECLASGVWPGYPDEVQNINLPAWAQEG